MRLLLFIICICSIQNVFGQVKAKFHTVERHMGLYDSPYKNSISGSFSYGPSIFMGDQYQRNSRLAPSQTFNFTVNKKIAERFSISVQAVMGELTGSGMFFDNPTYAYTDFSNNYFSFSILAREHFIKKGTNFNPNKKFQIHSSIGIGYMVSDVSVTTPYTNEIKIHQNVEALIIPGSLEFSYFIYENLGLMCTGDINYFYTDELDLKISNNDADFFLSTRIGMCFKFE
jgi:hypothetical protein